MVLPRGSIQVLGWHPHATSTASLLHQQGLKVTYVLLSAAVQGSLLREAVGLAGGRMMRQVSIHGRSICPGLEMTGGMSGCVRRASLQHHPVGRESRWAKSHPRTQVRWGGSVEELPRCHRALPLRGRVVVVQIKKLFGTLWPFLGLLGLLVFRPQILPVARRNLFGTRYVHAVRRGQGGAQCLAALQAAGGPPVWERGSGQGRVGSGVPAGAGLGVERPLPVRVALRTGVVGRSLVVVVGRLRLRLVGVGHALGGPIPGEDAGVGAAWLEAPWGKMLGVGGGRRRLPPHHRAEPLQAGVDVVPPGRIWVFQTRHVERVELVGGSPHGAGVHAGEASALPHARHGRFGESLPAATEGFLQQAGGEPLPLSAGYWPLTRRPILRQGTPSLGGGQQVPHAAWATGVAALCRPRAFALPCLQVALHTGAVPLPVRGQGAPGALHGQRGLGMR